MDQERDYRGTEKRRVRRSRVLLGAKLLTPGGDLDVRLRNLSQTGALLECAEAPRVGTEVTFHRGDTNAAARVIWSDGSRFGLEFFEPIHESEVLVHIAPPVPRAPMPEAPSPSAHRSGFHSNTLSPEERRLGQDWFQSGGRSVD